MNNDLQQLTKSLFEKMRKVDELMEDMRNIVADIQDHLEAEEEEEEVVTPTEDNPWDAKYEELGFEFDIDTYYYFNHGVNLEVIHTENDEWYVYTNNDEWYAEFLTGQECYNYVKLLILDRSNK